MEDKVLFKKQIGSKGNVLGVTIPVELLDYLEATNGTEVVMCADSGKHGRFVSMWVEKKKVA